CHIVTVGTYTVSTPFNMDGSELATGLAAAELEDEVTLLVVPEAVQLSGTPGARATLHDAMLAQCARLQDRFSIMDALVVADPEDPDSDGDTFRGDVGADNLKYGAAYYPSLNTFIPYYYTDDTTIEDDRTGDDAGPYHDRTLTVIRDGQDTGDPTDIEPDKTLYNLILAELQKHTVHLYPSGAMAGIYARVDRERGVWKAPANVGVQRVKKPDVLVTEEEQGFLNVHPGSGKSVNVIRRFEGKGNLVWGARTLAGNDNEWRYINVRRLFIFVEESCKKASEFVVFEPNDAKTWLRVKTMIENFLTQLWREGALAGAKPDDAFRVNIGLGITMTPLDILEGRMNVEIAMAAVRPAEFIILKFSHKLQES
ncbi:MAG: phage tail sheath C-terminal domain-containing protein, partial [Cyclobacteriaceae bacterium]